MFGKFKKKYALRLIVSMLAVLLIPCCILYLVYTSFIVKSVVEQVDEIIHSELLSSVRLMDSELESYEERIDFLEKTESYQAYAKAHVFQTDESGEILSILLKQDINYVYLLDSNISCIILYLHDVNTVISSGVGASVTRPAVFFENYYQNEKKDMLRLLGGRTSDVILGADGVSLRGKSGEYITLLYPIGAECADYGIVCVSVESFADFFNIQNNGFAVSTLVFDSKGEYLFSTNANRELVNFLCAEENRIPAECTEQLVEWNGKEYLAVQEVSLRSGLRAVSLLPRDNSIYLSLFNVSHFSIIFLIATGVLGSLAIFLLVKFNYDPVKKLRAKAQDSVEENMREGVPTNDIDMIFHTLNYLQGENRKLSTAMRSNVEAIRTVRLQQLLNDSYTSVEEFNTDCEQIDCYFDYPCFFVSIFLIPADMVDSKNLIADVLSYELGVTIKSIYVPSTNRRHIVFIHNVPEIDRIDRFEPFYSALGLLNDRFSMTCTVGVGHVQDGTAQISNSMVQAVNALDYRFVRGRGTVIPYDEISTNLDADYPYPSTELRHMQNALLSNDSEKLLDSINCILQFIADNDMPSFLARSICADIIKTCLSNSNNQSVNVYPFSRALTQLNEAETVTDLFVIIRNIQSKISRLAEENPSSNNNHLIQEVVEYINANYSRCDFSIQEVAGHFSMLPSTLSGLFKEQMNCNMLDYVIELRMNLAKQLLSTTTLPLRDLSEQVGYYNVSSFIRRFKKHEGITPNTYRFQMGGSII